MSNSLMKGIVGLSLSSLVGQGLSLLILPLLARFYSVEEFGIYGVYLNVIGAVLLFASLNYDVAIPIPRLADEALQLLAFCILSVFVISGILWLALYFSFDQYVDWIDLKPLGRLKYLIPLGFFGAGIFSAIHYYAVREKQYELIAKTNIYQSVAQNAIQVLAGVFNLNALGLILGDILNRSAGIGTILRTLVSKHILELNFKPKWSSIWQQLLQQRSFFIFGLPSNAAITFSTSLPPLFIAAIWGPKILGLYIMATKICTIPHVFVGRATSKVFYAEAASLQKKSGPDFFIFFKKTAARLLVFSLTVPLVCTAFYLSVNYLFGEQWSQAAPQAFYLIPLLMAQVVVSPISQVATILKKQKIELYISLIRLVFILFVFHYAFVNNSDFYSALLVYSVGSAVLYFIYFIVYYVLASKYGGRGE